MEMRSTCCLTSAGAFTGDYYFVNGTWVTFQHHKQLPHLNATSYVVTQLPVDFHCHGIAQFDFSELHALDLHAIEAALAAEGVRAVLTLYLRKDNFDIFCEIIEAFARAKHAHKFPSIIGFALEGPMLTSPGGTPQTTIWPLTKKQWVRLASFGEKGLAYIVLSPDVAIGRDAHMFLGSDPLPASIEWIVENLIDGGVMPALGHFQKHDPLASAAVVRRLANLCSRRGKLMVSDHLLNDMPHHITYAWRCNAERKNRADYLARLHLSSWTIDNVAEKLGPVPGELIRSCIEGAMKPCLNFDGEHVDIAISARLVELLGSANIVGITDRIASHRLGGRVLTKSTENTLLYQADGLVAAGTQAVSSQVRNMLLAGLRSDDIWNIFSFVPVSVLGHQETSPHALPNAAFYIQPGTAPLPLIAANWHSKSSTVNAYFSGT